jgi:hypothetical protein
MTVLTGADGQLLNGTQAFAKCRDWSITINRDALEDTCLGNMDRTYVEGLRGTTGSATLLYDPSNSVANNFLNTILEDSGSTQELTFKLNRKNLGNGGGAFTCTGFLTSISPSISVGDVQAVSVSFQVSGKPSGEF